MAKYMVKRILICLPVFLGITLVVFFLLDGMAGSLVDLMGADVPAAGSDRAALAAYLELDQPLFARYAVWLSRLLHFDLGTSFRTGIPVGELVLVRMQASLLLTGAGMLFSVALALALGICSALKPQGVLDCIAGTLTVAGSATPGFFVSLLLIYVFSVRLQLLPAVSSGGVRDMILPLLVICISNTGGLLKQVRTACCEVLAEPYIKTARAKGLGTLAIVRAHVLRNASLTIVTAVLSHLPHIIGGSMVVERIFGWPGMGSLLFSAISQRDYPVVMGVTVVIALAVLATSLLLDILYGLLDPRVRYEGR